MKINTINPFINNKVFNKQKSNTGICNFENPTKPSELMAYPKNYYISFGSNQDIFAQMENDLKAGNTANIRANFGKLTQTAQNNVKDLV